MGQPIKKSGTYQKPRSKTVKKSQSPTSPKRRKTEPTVGEIIKKRIARSKKPHPKYGTSKLEKRFAKNFLDKLGVDYEYQYEAKEIKRFYDFAIHLEGGGLILIECDGVYYHGKGLMHEEKSPMQKHNEYVDKEKDKWAAIHGIPLIRIWEDDINDRPSEVMKMLEERLGVYDEKNRKKINKGKRH